MKSHLEYLYTTQAQSIKMKYYIQIFIEKAGTKYQKKNESETEITHSIDRVFSQTLSPKTPKILE